MKPPRRISTAVVATVAAAALEWPLASSLYFAQPREFPPLSVEVLCLAIAFFTWALLFAAAFSVILRVPKSWHLVARAAAILAVAYALLTVGQMALVAPLYLLNFICIKARVCEVSLFAEAVNVAFSKHAFHRSLPELLLVVPLVVGIGVAVRNPFRRKVNPDVGEHAA